MTTIVRKETLATHEIAQENGTDSTQESASNIILLTINDISAQINFNHF